MKHWSVPASSWQRWLPSRGNVIFTLLLLSSLFFAGRAGALPGFQPDAPEAPSSNVIAYQGRLADAAGVPLTGSYPMTFALYSAASGGSALWTESRTVSATDGVFSLMLGEVTPIPASLAANPSLYLGVRVGSDAEMTPRKQLGSVGYAFQAITVPDGSITTAKLNVNADVDMAGFGLVNSQGLSNNNNSVRVNVGGDTLRLVSTSNIYAFIDSDNNQSDRRFTIYANNDSIAPPVVTLWSIGESGQVQMSGPLHLNGNAIVDQGALIEAGLQTAAELAAVRIERFDKGDVLCFIEGQLEKCAIASDQRIVAVADENGKPIVLGAELIKVIGPVHPGDLLVASDVPGYAMVDNNPESGTDIAKALEALGGDKGLVRSMIRTP